MPAGVGYGSRELEAIAKGPAGKLLPGPISMFKGEQLKKLTGFVKSEGYGSSMGKYLGGQSVKVEGGALKWGGANDAARMHRRTAFGVGGGLLAAQTLGIDPLGITSAGSSLYKAGGHVAIGSTMMKVGGKTKLAGMAYLGVGAANLFQSGDQLGPM